MLEAAHSEQVPEDAQHLPRRPRLAERPHHAFEALRRAFGIDERPGSFGERRDRQQHVRVFRCLVLVRAHRDHEFCCLHRRDRLKRIMGIQLGFDAEQEIRLARLCEHAGGIEASA